MSDKSQYARIHDRDSVLVGAKHTSPPSESSPPSPSESGTQTRPSLRKKVSRAFSSLARRASSASLKGERRDETHPPPVPPIERKATTSSSSSSSTSSSSRNAVTDRASERRDTSTANAIISYSYPIWRVDPVLIGCFVCL
ncbi:hypothetical protein C8Q80DRAFT_1166392 [Daedaleopsis nitida]|nr:hypothetical protein C8Q80DRAFT_1166392 [Daedaleopsis nitida]